MHATTTPVTSQEYEYNHTQTNIMLRSEHKHNYVQAGSPAHPITTAIQQTKSARAYQKHTRTHTLSMNMRNDEHHAKHW